MRRSPRQRLQHLLPQVGGIEFHTVTAQSPPDNLRSGVENAGPNEPIVPIAAFHDLAVVHRRKQRLHLIGEHPRMTVEHTRARIGVQL